MEKFKFILFSVVTLALLGLLGYWSFNTIQSGTEHAADEKIRQLKKQNEDLKIEVEKLTIQLAAIQPKKEEPITSVNKEPEPTANKYQDLIGELQKLVDAKVFMKDGSTGSRVGTVQKFLNIYFNTSVKVDNGYGGGTAKRVEDFQRAEGLSPDGEAGPNTFIKMIDWLKKQK